MKNVSFYGKSYTITDLFFYNISGDVVFETEEGGGIVDVVEIEESDMEIGVKNNNIERLLGLF